MAAQECTTNQNPGQQVDPTLDNDYNSQISASVLGSLDDPYVADEDGDDLEDGSDMFSDDKIGFEGFHNAVDSFDNTYDKEMAFANFHDNFPDGPTTKRNLPNASYDMISGTKIIHLF